MTLPAPPTDGQTERLRLAVLYKATRFFTLAEAPLGVWGEPTEFGQAVVRPDHQIRELLYGLHKTVGDLDEGDLSDLVSIDDVVRAGLQLDPAGFPEARRVDVQRAIDSAADWVRTNVYESWGVG